jgi:ribosomal protein S18 acetylase RimI-like enzyme
MAIFRERTFALKIPITIRLCREDDLPKLEWYGQHSQFRQVFARTFREQTQGQRLMLVADCKGFPIGQVFVQLDSKEKQIATRNQRAYLYSLRVMEMFRGMGIGSSLIDEAETNALRLGYRWTTIAAAKQNAAAIRLYNRKGYKVFAEDARRWSYVDAQGETQYQDEPCWLMQKKIHLR